MPAQPFKNQICLSMILLGTMAISACSVITNTPTTQLSDEINNTIISSKIWQPDQGLSYQIQFTGEFDLSVDADVFDLDSFDTQRSTIDLLHQDGKKVICYINAGAVEDWRSDFDSFPSSIIGKSYQGWPGENWLDIRRLDILVPLLEARMDQCKAKGFDGVEFDNVDGYQNETGFNLTGEDQLIFNRWLAETAHQHGLAVGLKNDPDQITDLEPWFDFLILESCFEQDWCEKAQPFLEAGKPVIAIEYTQINQFCPLARELSIILLQKKLLLNAWMKTCH